MTRTHVVVTCVFLASWVWLGQRFGLADSLSATIQREAISAGAAMGISAPAREPCTRSDRPGVVRVTPDSIAVPIIVYHSVAHPKAHWTAAQREYNVPPDVFEAQMAYLREIGVAVVTFSALVDAVTAGCDLPGRAVVLTFDDGWVTQYEHAVPVLERFGYDASFFVFTNPLGRDARFMTWPQLRELRHAGFEIGSHSRTHPYLTRLDDPRAMRVEVAGSREVLERELGGTIRYFAHPFGVSTTAVEAAVREAGYVAARAFPGGRWNSGATQWSLRSVGAPATLTEFRRLVSRAMAS